MFQTVKALVIATTCLASTASLASSTLWYETSGGAATSKGAIWAIRVNQYSASDIRVEVAAASGTCYVQMASMTAAQSLYTTLINPVSDAITCVVSNPAASNQTAISINFSKNIP